MFSQYTSQFLQIKKWKQGGHLFIIDNILFENENRK